MRFYQVKEIVGIVRELVGDRRDMLPPSIEKEDVANITNCATTDPLGYTWVDEFEKQLRVHSSSHAVAVSSGTAGLHLALKAVGVKEGDEVLLPAMTFANAAAAITYCGARPHFIDVHLTPFGAVNAFKLDRYLRSLGEDVSRIKAMIAVDLLGHPGVSPELGLLARTHKIALIEDAAAALGSMRGNWPCGTLGDISVISFNRNKIVTTGGGGAVLTYDPEIAHRVRYLAATAKKESKWHYVHDDIGYNYRMPNTCAALAVGQLLRLPRILERKRKLHQRYLNAFALWPSIGLVRDEGDNRWNGWLNAIMIDTRHADEYEKARDSILQGLSDAGYGCRAMFTPLHWLLPYKDCPRMNDLSVAEDIYRRTVCLPSGVR